MALLLLKLTLTPLLIGGASLAARRWGPSIGGWIVALPLTSGPVALYLAIDQGTAYATSTATASLVPRRESPTPVRGMGSCRILRADP